MTVTQAEPAERDLAGSLAEQARERLTRDPEGFLRRLHRWGPDLLDGLSLYLRAEHGAGSGRPIAERVVDLLVDAHEARRPALAALDEERLLRPDWFAQPDQVGYVCYPDRFAGTLRGVGERIGYLRELGVTYLHLMPLLQPREGPDDGGYAVQDYRMVRADLGTMKDLEGLCDDLHESGIALTLDLVLNHVAKEHAWAQAAVRGEAPYRDYFLMYPDRDLPNAYERTLPEIFPDFAPGSFTWEPGVLRPDGGEGAWVWTTFNSYQWDLDWTNPDVFCELLDVILTLANVGVDCLRLDAIAFLWKRMGTSCQNQPEVHRIVQALRAAARVATPGVIFKAEAIVSPEELPAYLGRGPYSGRVCDLAYHNSLMVQLWSALATGSAVLARQALAVPPPKPVTTAWTTYIRCHDDIGWAVSDADAGALGLSGHAHRGFLSAWYSGSFPGSFARGEVFQANPATGDARISGTLASLAGLEAALHPSLQHPSPQHLSPHPSPLHVSPRGASSAHRVQSGDQPAVQPGAESGVDLALGRIFLLHAVIYGYGGIPLLYMGDELGLLNDPGYLDDPRLAEDNRWLHRPVMSWEAAQRRHDPTTVEGRIFSGIRHLARIRAGLPSLHAAVESAPVDVGAPAVLGLLRRHPSGAVLQLYNMSSTWQRVPAHQVSDQGFGQPWENLSAFRPFADGDHYSLPPYAAWWLSGDAPENP